MKVGTIQGIMLGLAIGSKRSTRSSSYGAKVSTRAARWQTKFVIRASRKIPVEIDPSNP
jgi:hypothetical protein